MQPVVPASFWLIAPSRSYAAGRSYLLWTVAPSYYNAAGRSFPLRTFALSRDQLRWSRLPGIGTVRFENYAMMGCCFLNGKPGRHVHIVRDALDPNNARELGS